MASSNPLPWPPAECVPSHCVLISEHQPSRTASQKLQSLLTLTFVFYRRNHHSDLILPRESWSTKCNSEMVKCAFHIIYCVQKSSVSWDVKTSKLVNFIEISLGIPAIINDPEEGGSIFIRNICYIAHYLFLHSLKLISSEIYKSNPDTSIHFL